MPSIHAILLVALGGVLGADAHDALAQQRPAVEDPFSAPADYRAPTPRQPWTEPGGNSPPTVRLAQPPLPADFGPMGQNDASAMGPATVVGGGNGELDASGDGFGAGNVVAASWEGPTAGSADGGSATIRVKRPAWKAPLRSRPADNVRQGRSTCRLPAETAICCRTFCRR